LANLTVMTWNIQNLFPVGHQDGPATQQDYDDKVTALAEVIDAVEPDVLALQEVGPEQVLGDLNAACSIAFDHRLTGIPDRRGIRVALLSPRRLSNRVDITTYPVGLLPVQSRDLTSMTRPPKQTRPCRAPSGAACSRRRCGWQAKGSP
jgi:endonuclease/exonuclease/phosphatase family protein